MPLLIDVHPDIKAMKGLHVYHNPMSNCAMRVCLAVEEKGLDWNSHVINLLTQENLSDDYLSINPKGLVPAIVHDGVVVKESIDILRYLEETFPAPALYPSDAKLRVEVDAWMDRATQRHMPMIKTFMYGSMGMASKKPEDMPRYRDIQKDKELLAFHEQTLKKGGIGQADVQRAEQELRETLDQIESELTQHDWLVGNHYTYADIAWFPQYLLLSARQFIDFSSYPQIRQWAAACKERPSFEKGINVFREKWPAFKP